MILSGGVVGVAVGVSVGVEVAVSVGVGVAVSVGVGVLVAVAVGVLVEVAVDVGVAVGIGAVFSSAPISGCAESRLSPSTSSVIGRLGSLSRSAP
jgi:hypothetical protein